MALLWCDGFDSYGTSGNSVSMSSKYAIDNPSDADVAAGRDAGLYAFRCETTARVFTPHLTTNATLIAGVAFKLQNTSVASRTLLSFRIPSYDGSTIGLRSIDVVTTGNTDLYVNFNNSDMGSTTNLGLTANTWYYLEFKVVTDASAGSFSVKLDGTEIIADSSVDTRFSSTYPFYSTAGFIGTASQYVDYDDFYVCDGTGSTNNDFLGPCIVRDIYPTADASGNWTANGGGDKYTEVDETSLDITSFISTNTTGNQQIFETANLSIGAATIKGVMVSTAAKLSANLMMGIKTLTQQGTGTVNVGTTYPVDTDNYVAITHIQELDPDGNTWNESRLNTFRIGVRAI
jgi:hypothetical protein